MKKRLIFLFCLLSIFTFSLTEKTDIVGPTSKEQILKHFPEWADFVKAYSPDPEIINQLKNINRSVTIEVFLGTWCPDSKSHVSEYFKIMESVDNPLFFSNYIGLPRDKQARIPFIKGKDIVRIPTFIILIDGLEKGRIVEHPVDSLERDLLNFVSESDRAETYEFCQSNYHADLPLNCIDCHLKF
ncbi:MAG: hypothetical protein JXB26_05685 [Candidatus Aminicenantes bacterium]|nr:hypothetical protein [Candidatus Aminicenantes bacterium]